MNAEIIFTGMLLMVNVHDADPTLTEPAVVAVKAEATPHMMRHVPFIAFNRTTTKLTVSDNHSARAVPKKTMYPGAENWSVFELQGELEIVGSTGTKPTVAPDYDDAIASRDKYWPEAKGKWNYNLVPKRGEKPKKTEAAFFMRLRSGTLSPGEPLVNEWVFPLRKGQTKPYGGKFAREVKYIGFQHEPNAITIVMKDLATGAVIRKLIFEPKGNSGVVLYVGNNVDADLPIIASGRIPLADTKVTQATHFSFLNKSAPPNFPNPPIPKRIIPPNPKGGGISDGFCGPTGQP